MTVEQLEAKSSRLPGKLKLVTDSQDVSEILRRNGFGKKTIERYQGLFVVESNGEVKRIYAFRGTVPYLTKEVELLNLQ